MRIVGRGVVGLFTAWAAGAALALGAGAEGTRVGTVDLAAAQGLQARPLASLDDVIDAARQREVRAALAERAAGAGAEVVWDTAGQSLIGVSPVLYADTALALPGAGAARIVTVDLAALYDNHAKVRAHNREVRANEDATQKAVDARNAAGNALVAEYMALAKAGDKEGAARKRTEVDAKREEIMAFMKQERAGLKQRLEAFRSALLRELAAEAVAAARARGATLVLETSGPSLLGVSPLVQVDAALRSEAGGEPQAARIRTVDLARLYAQHPQTIAAQARLKEDQATLNAEIDRLNLEAIALVEDFNALTKRGDQPAADKARTKLAAKRSEVNAHRQKALEQAKARLSAHRAEMLKALTASAGAVARREGAQLLVDSSGPSFLGVSFLAYAAPELDLTAAVAKELGLDLAR